MVHRGCQPASVRTKVGARVETIKACKACRDGEPLGFDFTMAFQPIVDLKAGRVWGYEALVRGPNGESAWSVLSQVTDENRYKFDQAARVRAIELAGQLFPPGAKLSINFMPNAVYEPKACIRASLDAAQRVGFDRRRIMFEFTENERMADVGHVHRIIDEYKKIGFTTALDDFGAGYAGLNLLAKFRPDLIKIDMEVIRGVDGEPAKQVIIAGIICIAEALGVTVLAEGVETEAETRVLHAAGIDLMQGYYFAKPAVASLPEVAHLPVAAEFRLSA
jgi:EAL domain-containing protein (putative c-di-GMP-specific phosphodiesterase class I)